VANVVGRLRPLLSEDIVELHVIGGDHPRTSGRFGSSGLFGFASRLLGRAGFEPAISCSQITRLACLAQDERMRVGVARLVQRGAMCYPRSAVGALGRHTTRVDLNLKRP
jgi:hypothetical protein